MIDYRLLEYFLAVSDELHFTRAAEKLRVSQPTLSHQIRLLEHQLGTALFNRIGKRIYLTEAGEILHRHALTIFHELEQAQIAIRELSGLQRGRLRIGCSGNHLLTQAILAFHQQHPKVELSVEELATEVTCEGLISNQLDLGLVFLPVEHIALKSIPLFDEELLWVVNEAHPYASRQAVELAELQQARLMLLQKRFYVRQMIEEECTRAGFELKPFVELSTLESLIQMTMMGVGTTILPRSYVLSMKEPTLRFIPLANPAPRKQVGIVYRKETYLCASIHTFIQVLEQAYGMLQQHK